MNPIETIPSGKCFFFQIKNQQMQVAEYVKFELLQNVYRVFPLTFGFASVFFQLSNQQKTSTKHCCEVGEI